MYVHSYIEINVRIYDRTSTNRKVSLILGQYYNQPFTRLIKINEICIKIVILVINLSVRTGDKI